MFWGLSAESWKWILSILSSMTPLLTASVLIVTLRLTKSLKRAEITNEFNRRFDALTEFAHSIEIKALEKGIAQQSPSGIDNKSMISYYRRYFNLQFDQFVAYQSGLVERPMFEYWMLSRAREFISPDATVAGMSYRAAWKHFDKNPLWIHHPFNEFMSKVHKGEAEALAAVRGLRGRWLKRKLGV